jgi:protein-S-isoprenylcysteine O-methyltransferase Ste14
MSLFGLFLVWGPLSPVDLGLGETGSVVVNGLLSLAFFVQHSVMIRRSFRQRLARVVAPNSYGAVYAMASGAVLFALVVFWQESTRLIVEFQGTARWLLRCLVPAALVIVAAGVRALGRFDALGIHALRAGAADGDALPLAIRGPYRWVRHPMYLAVLMVLWAYPALTADRLLLNVLWTVWVVVGTVLEERDLVAAFGDPYREYQRAVPMLIPWRRPRELPGTGATAGGHTRGES